MSNVSFVGGSLSQVPPAGGQRPPVVQGSGSDVAVASTSRMADAAPSPATSAPAANAVTPAQLTGMVGDMQKKVETYSPELQFSIDQDSGKSIVKLTDTGTDTLIWQFPSEQALQISKELDQYQQGLVVNKKV